MKKKLLLNSLLLSGSLLVALQASPVFAAEEDTAPSPAETVQPTEEGTAVENTETPSVKVTVRYTNGMPLAEGSEVTLKKDDTMISKKANAEGVVVFTEEDGLVKGTTYDIIGSNIKSGSTVTFLENGLSEVSVTAGLPGSELPLIIKATVRYTNGLPVPEGTEVRLRNLTDGSTEVFKKLTDEDGVVTFTEEEGVKKAVSYSLETDGLHNGKTIRYALGGEREQSLTVKLPGAEKPLTLKVIAVDRNGKPIKAGTEIRLRNIKDFSKPVIIKTLDEKGEAVFTEADGLLKEFNYSIEADGITIGYTVGYGLGGDKEKTVVFDGVETSNEEGNTDTSTDTGEDKKDASTDTGEDKKDASTDTGEDKKVLSVPKEKIKDRKKAELPKTGAVTTGLGLGLASLLAGATIFKKKA